MDSKKNHFFRKKQATLRKHIRLIGDMVNDYVGFNFLAGIEKVPPGTFSFPINL